MLIYLLQGLGLGFAAVVQPGPFLAYLITQTMAVGFRKTWYNAFAPLLSDGPIILVTLLVLTHLPNWLQRGLNLASGLFILYLAWGSFQQYRHFVSPDEIPLGTRQPGIFKAVLMNMLSPNPYIFWSLVNGPILLAGWKISPAVGISFLLGFYTILIGGLLVILALFGLARSLGSRVSRIFLGISALALFIFGLVQLWRGLF